jgi:hypothetical protein
MNMQPRAVSPSAERLGRLRLAHVDAQIARGRLVPLRRRQDTRAIDTSVLWLEPCDECGAELNTKGRIKSKRPLCQRCTERIAQTERAKPRTPDKRHRKVEEIDAAVDKALHEIGYVWFRTRRLVDATGVDANSIWPRLLRMCRDGKMRSRKINAVIGREWRLKRMNVGERHER